MCSLPQNPVAESILEKDCDDTAQIEVGRTPQTDPEDDDADLGEGNGTGLEKEEEDAVSGFQITEPFDPARIRVDTRPMVISLLMERIRNVEIDLTPGFQRKGGIWSAKAKSRLIESLLIRIPLPAFYMDGSDESKWLVVDCFSLPVSSF